MARVQSLATSPPPSSPYISLRASASPCLIIRLSLSLRLSAALERDGDKEKKPKGRIMPVS